MMTTAGVIAIKEEEEEEEDEEVETVVAALRPVRVRLLDVADLLRGVLAGVR